VAAAENLCDGSRGAPGGGWEFEISSSTFACYGFKSDRRRYGTEAEGFLLEFRCHVGGCGIAARLLFPVLL